MMIQPGAVVTVDFPGAMGIKRRPAVVISTPTYHATRPDLILAVVTSQTAGAIAPTDKEIELCVKLMFAYHNDGWLRRR